MTDDRDHTLALLPESSFSPEQVAKFWGCTPAHVRRLIRQGRLRAWRLGGARGHLRIKQSAIWEFEECHQNITSASTEEKSASSGDQERTASAIRSARLIQPQPGPVSVNSRGLPEKGQD